MGQKIIPISLRLNKRKNWESKWIVNKNEYSSLLFLDLEIKKYFYKLLNTKDYELVNINIKKISKNINIYLYINDKRKKKKKSKKKKNFLKIKKKKKIFNKLLNNLNIYYKNYYFKIFTRLFRIKKKTNKKIIQLMFDSVKKKYRINFYNKQMIYTFYYVLFFNNINIITILLKKMLEKKKRHKKIIQNINNIFEIFFNIFSNIIGYKLQFKGRLNGFRRKKKITYQKGKNPLNTLKYNIKYNFNEFKTPSGICSIKFWIFLKK